MLPDVSVISMLQPLSIRQSKSFAPNIANAPQVQVDVPFVIGPTVLAPVPPTSWFAAIVPPIPPPPLPPPLPPRAEAVDVEIVTLMVPLTYVEHRTRIAKYPATLTCHVPGAVAEDIGWSC